eukprot:785111-Pyramimonas_sp.AAC.1
MESTRPLSRESCGGNASSFKGSVMRTRLRVVANGHLARRPELAKAGPEKEPFIATSLADRSKAIA